MSLIFRARSFSSASRTRTVFAHAAVSSQTRGRTADHGSPPTLSMNTSVLIQPSSDSGRAGTAVAFSVIVPPRSVPSDISVHELRLALAFVTDHEDQQRPFRLIRDLQFLPVRDVVETKGGTAADIERSEEHTSE